MRILELKLEVLHNEVFVESIGQPIERLCLLFCNGFLESFVLYVIHQCHKSHVEGATFLREPRLSE